jgi:hypothetical protein
MGFTRCLLPGNNLKHLKGLEAMALVGVQSVSELLDVLF